MVDIRPNVLPAAILPLRSGDALIVDQGADGVRQTDPFSMTDSVAPVATQSEAIAGTNNTKRMTALRTKQSIASEVGISIASNSQGAKADSAVQSVNGKTGNTITITKADVGLGNVDNTSDLDKPISTATQTALNAKANSSVTISAGAGLDGGGNLTANRTVSLNAASIASLAKADSSVQSVNGVSPTAGNVTVSAEEKRLQDTRTTAIAESFGSNVLFVETAGYSLVGDGGGALYKRVSSEPSHAGKFQSADGAWWELAERIPNVYQFGAKIDGVTDDTDAYQYLCEYCLVTGADPDFGSGIAVLSRQITVPTNRTIYAGNLVLDYSSASGGSIPFPNNSCLYAYGGAQILLPSITNSPPIGSTRLIFASAHGLQPGDLICIENPTDGSLNTFRTYYKAGEFARVLEVEDANIVRLTAPLLDAYNASDIDLYKMPAAGIHFSVGSLSIKGSDTVQFGFQFRNLQRSTFNGISCVGSREIEIGWYNCVDGTGRDITTGKISEELTSVYGGFLSNCQNMRLDGNWMGGRHGFTLTGTGIAGYLMVPCRGNKISGEFSNMIQNSWCSCQAHGNAIDYEFSGWFRNGVTLGGNYGRVRGRVDDALYQENGTVSFAEMHGTTFNIDADITAYSNPIEARGTIDIGGGNTALSAPTKQGGCIKISGTLHAPNSDRLLRMRNQGAVGLDIGLDVSGLKITGSKPTGVSTSFQVQNVVGDPINYLDLTGFILPDGHGWSVDTVQKVFGWRKSLKTTLNTTTSINAVSGTLNFNAPKIPCVSISIGDSSPGGKSDSAVAFNGNLLSRTRVDPIIASASGNFTGAESVPVHVMLSVDE